MFAHREHEAILWLDALDATVAEGLSFMAASVRALIEIGDRARAREMLGYARQHLDGLRLRVPDEAKLSARIEATLARARQMAKDEPQSCSRVIQFLDTLAPQVSPLFELAALARDIEPDLAVRFETVAKRRIDEVEDPDIRAVLQAKSSEAQANASDVVGACGAVWSIPDETVRVESAVSAVEALLSSVAPGTEQ